MRRADFKTTEGESMSSPQAIPLQSVSMPGLLRPVRQKERARHTMTRLRMRPGRMGNGSKDRKSLRDEPALVLKDFISKSCNFMSLKSLLF